MAQPRQTARASTRNRVVRRCRQGALLLVLLAIGVLLYASQVGLPGFLKSRLQSHLEDRGVELEFERVRWRWERGVVAENVRVRFESADLGDARFVFDQGVFGLRRDGWLDWRPDIDSLDLENGRLEWRDDPADEAATLSLTNIHTALRMAGDEWELIDFTSEALGVRFRAQGRLANPRGLFVKRGRDPETPRSAARLTNLLHRIDAYLDEFELSEQPAISLFFTGDAADRESLSAKLNLVLPRGRSRWGSVENLRLRADLRGTSATSTNTAQFGTMSLAGDAADTPWGTVRDWRLNTRSVPVFVLPQRGSNHVNGVFGELETPWGKLVSGSVDVRLRHSTNAPDPGLWSDLTLRANGLSGARVTADTFALEAGSRLDTNRWLPLGGSFSAELTGVRHDTNHAGRVKLAARLDDVNWSALNSAPEEWGFWRPLGAYQFGLALEVEDLTARGLALNRAAVAGEWDGARLNLTNVAATLYGGDLDAALTVDVPTGDIGFRARTDFDLHGLDPLFSPRMSRWAGRYQWSNPPHATASGKLRWPDWRVLTPDWKTEVVPTVGFSGRFESGPASYRDIHGDAASSDFYFTNFIWNLPNLTVVRPEGTTVAVYDGDETTRDYRWKMTSTIDPLAVRPAFADQPGVLKAFDYLETREPFEVEATIHGRWRAPERTGFEATVRAPRPVIRGEAADLITGHVTYTNRLLVAHDIYAEQSNHVARAESLTVDFDRRLMWFTNVVGDISPYSVTRVIGPVTARTVEPYRFEGFPEATVNGVLQLKDGHEATDLRFTLSGTNFNWWRFNVDRIGGDLHWRDQTLFLTNVTADFYGGLAAGAGRFDFGKDDAPTRVRFDTTLANVDVQGLINDTFATTNRLEGDLSGSLTVTDALATDFETWQGFGEVRLTDGYIWQVPLFSIFTPLLDAVSPGLGHSRAKEAGGTFTLVNGTLISTDLEVRSPNLWLEYEGTLDLTGNIDARIQAKLLRDAGLIGQVVGAALSPFTKIFEYQIDGTLADPVARPLYIPRFIRILFEPFRSLRDIVRPENFTPLTPAGE